MIKKVYAGFDSVTISNLYVRYQKVLQREHPPAFPFG